MKVNMIFRGVALLLCIMCPAHCLLEQNTQTKNEMKDVLLESGATHSTAIEELRKQIGEIVKELNALKEVHALQLVCLKGIKVPGKCFLASPVKKNFYDATDDCILQGGSLGTPVTGNENYQLYVYVHEMIGPKEQIWLGINDMLKEGEWVDKSGSRIRFQNWETEVTRQPVGGRSQNCAFMSVIDSGKWFDENCRAVKAFVCEFNIV
ncbi:tetranectin isoform X1 [Ictalurus punctatus]|uniref:Tetranectin isoform X1 n=1 Tax=Ictalurus punctatus TaxID=7998 RepID=A0A2D0QR99_ICTPU|nr:tetranectin isoform X1 [Ictalurus punctatus]XP_017320829.1 tetranectin isoform X1 [Ictalurus punctatus]